MTDGGGAAWHVTAEHPPMQRAELHNNSSEAKRPPARANRTPAPLGAYGFEVRTRHQARVKPAK